jgi:2Fe-2S ferredoxin
VPIIRYEEGDSTIEVDAPVGTTVKDAGVESGIDGIVAECGGNLLCATCHVYVGDGWVAKLPAISEDEEEMLGETAAPRQSNSRLSCQLEVTDALDGLTVRVPDTQV